MSTLHCELRGRAAHAQRWLLGSKIQEGILCHEIGITPHRCSGNVHARH